MIKNFRNLAVFALAAATAGAFAGCSSNGTNPGVNGGTESSESTEFGGVNLKLTVPNNFQVNSIHYDIVDQSTNQIVVSKDADVSSADAVARAFVLLPPGSYIANLTAQGDQPCAGSTSVFTVQANSNQTVQAALTCGTTQAVVGGGVFINGTFTQANTCGITRLFVGPLMQGAGEDITLSGAATPAASFAWSASGSVGTVNNGTQADATFTCGSAGGNATITLTIQDTNNPGCSATQSVDVVCAASPLCGNGALDSGEACDDGNNANNDGCSSVCATEVCGDGIVQSNEQCEASLSPSNCVAATCLFSVCGNNVQEPGEGCDGGPLCSATCTPLLCGNGTVDSGEQCDDGNQNSADHCTNACAINVVCGDGFVDAPEVCDTALDPQCASDCLSITQPPASFGCPGAAGQACQAANCSYELSQCNSAECQAVQTCIYSTGCVYTVAAPPRASYLDACFCGIGSDINACYISGQTATGPCVAQFQAAAAPVTGNLSIAQVFYDGNYAMGDAGFLQYCQQTLCATECGY